MEDIIESGGVDPAAVVDAVMDGQLDGHLVEVLEAVRTRFQHGSTEQKWRISFDGDVFTQDDLTLAEAATVEKLTGTTWAQLNPTVSAQECQCIIAACLHHRQAMPVKDAMAKAGSMTTEDAVAAIDSYEVERAPKG